MNKKQIGIVLGITIVVLIASVVAVNTQQKAVVNQQAGDYLFPGLETKVNDVAKLEVLKGEQKVTIQRGDNNWQIVEKSNYPADVSKIKEVVMKIAGFTTIEAKTKKPENFGKLNVEDPAGEDAKSILVTLKDGADKELASVIIGRMLAGSFSTVGQDKTYVRKANEEQVWLVKGGLSVEEAATDWVTEEILNIESSRVKKIEITHKDGSKVSIIKDKPGEGDFQLANIPKGKELKTQSALTQVTRSMERVRMLDVQTAQGFEFPEGKTVTTELQTFDGLVVTAKTVRQSGNYLTNFTVNFDASLRPADEPATAEGEEKEANKEGEQTADPHAPKPAALKDSALVQQEASELNGRLSAWVFTLNKSKAKNLVEEMDDLVKDKS